MTDEEVRVVSDSGGMKGSKPAQMAWADPLALLEVAKVYGFGATKYSPTNYRQGYDWSLSYSALMRHLLAFWSGEDIDPESGLSHMAHACWHCLALLSFMREHPEYDDRYKPAKKNLPFIRAKEGTLVSSDVFMFRTDGSRKDLPA